MQFTRDVDDIVWYTDLADLLPNSDIGRFLSSTVARVIVHSVGRRKRAGGL